MSQRLSLLRVGLVGVGVGSGACTADTGVDTDGAATPAEVRRSVRVALNSQTVETYRDWAEASAVLLSAVDAYCVAPSSETLAAAQAAWWSARAPWKRNEIVMFGPATEQPYRIYPLVDLWPARTASIEELLAGTADVSAAAVGEMGGATRGLPALEYVLWTELPPPSEARRCDYARGLAADLVVLSAQMIAAWESDWSARLADPEQHDGDLYASGQDVLDEWVNRMLFTAGNIRSEKLGKPLGDSSGGEPQPDTLESRPSQRSLQDARDAHAGIADVFGPLGPLLPSDRAETLSAAFADAHAAAESALSAVPEPLEDALTAERDAVQAAQDALRELQVLLQVDIAQALSVTITFNDNDGD